jgi:hypothetical protein
MADENKDNATGDAGNEEQQAPADALSKTPDELEEDQAAKDAANPEAAAAKNAASGEKKISPLKKFLR